MSEAALILTLGKQSKNQEVLAQVLRGEGYAVETATELSAFRAVLADVASPELVIIDIDGYDEAIWDISERCAAEGVAVLIVASADADRVRAEAVEHGIEAVLSKPLDQNHLQNTIQSLL